MTPFKNANWIWINKGNNIDEYAEFTFNFESLSNKENFSINIASDSNYNLFLNEEILSFGQYADYPDYKVYDTIKLDKVFIGKNVIKIVVWHYGKDSQTYINDTAGVIFELIKNEQVIFSSSENTLSRLAINYDNYRNKDITYQLGLGYKYLANVENNLPFTKSVVVNKSRNFNSRPIKKLVLGERPPISITKLKDSYIIDMAEETVGFLDIEFFAEKETELKIYYAEFLHNGEIYKKPNDGFCVEYASKKGLNKYVNYFRRLAGRYLQIYSTENIDIKYAGLRPTTYPVTKTPVTFKSEKRNKIYDVAVKTLHCCMHEHYEDCPWREQALYNMDSRNTMLFTYLAFNDYEFARANLVLMSKGLMSDGLLNICFPSGVHIPIPSFSLMYPVQVCEYVENSGDLSVLDEVFCACESIINTFIKRIDEKSSLIYQFPAPYWNFYEWTYGSDNSDQIHRTTEEYYPKKADLIINLLFLYSLQYYKKLCAYKKIDFNFDESKIRKAIVETFYNAENKLFKATDIGKPFYTVLGNSLAILVGFDELININLLLPSNSKAEQKLVNYERDDENTVPEKIVPISLSMNIFLYDALLKKDKKYAKEIILDLDEKYSNMLDKGATTFWETIHGYKDFNMRGSLCHGWSALPILYYHLLNKKEYFDGNL